MIITVTMYVYLTIATIEEEIVSVTVRLNHAMRQQFTYIVMHT